SVMQFEPKTEKDVADAIERFTKDHPTNDKKWGDVDVTLALPYATEYMDDQLTVEMKNSDEGKKTNEAFKPMDDTDRQGFQGAPDDAVMATEGELIFLYSPSTKTLSLLDEGGAQVDVNEVGTVHDAEILVLQLKKENRLTLQQAKYHLDKDSDYSYET